MLRSRAGLLAAGVSASASVGRGADAVRPLRQRDVSKRRGTAHSLGDLRRWRSSKRRHQTAWAAAGSRARSTFTPSGHYLIVASRTGCTTGLRAARAARACGLALRRRSATATPAARRLTQKREARRAAANDRPLTAGVASLLAEARRRSEPGTSASFSWILHVVDLLYRGLAMLYTMRVRHASRRR